MLPEPRRGLRAGRSERWNWRHHSRVGRAAPLCRPWDGLRARARVTHAPRARSWQPNSFGTGGITLEDFRALAFNNISMLAGGTWLSGPGLGLRPWYLAGIAPLAQLAPSPSAAPAPAPAAAAPATVVPLGAAWRQQR